MKTGTFEHFPMHPTRGECNEADIKDDQEAEVHCIVPPGPKYGLLGRVDQNTDSLHKRPYNIPIPAPEAAP